MSVNLPHPSQVERTVARWRENSTDFVALLGRYGESAPALRHYGLLQWQERRYDLAAEAFGSALTLTPQDARLWSDLAGANEGMNLVEKAEDCLRRSIDLDASRADSWLSLAGLLNRRADRQGAEAAYHRSLSIDGSLADAHFGLGLLYFDQRRLSEAKESFVLAITCAPDHALARTCLAHTYYTSGDFTACAQMFASAQRLGSLDHASRLKLARAVTFQAMIDGRTDQALSAYPGLAGADAEEIDTICRDAFGLLSAFGHKDAAIEVGRRLMSRCPSDPIQRYLQDAVEGRPHTSAPLDYLESYFDRFAPEFDYKLVKILGYRVPEHLSALVERHRRDFHRMLDLGCGTGLAGAHLSPLGNHLIGIDVSERMLDAARRRGVYARLEKAEAVAFLNVHQGAFDLVFAADLLVYIGDLAPLIEAAATALRPGGFFAISIETGSGQDFSLLTSGRFAHAPDYIRTLALPRFEILDDTETTIRLEAGRPVNGRLAVLRLI